MDKIFSSNERRIYYAHTMRIWHGVVPKPKAEEYTRFLIEKAVPDYSSVDGLEKIYMSRKENGDVVHFLIVTIWDSMESIKRFTGDDPEIAKYYSEDDQYLLKKEKFVQHYEVFHIYPEERD